MKDKILNILKSVQSRKEFFGSKYFLTVNYDYLIKVDREKFSKTHNLHYYYLDENTESFVREKLETIDEVASFNLTFHIEEKVDKMFEAVNNEEYWDGYWKDSQFIFHTDDNDKVKFEYISYGSCDRDFRISKHLTEPDFDSDERYAEIKFNEKDFDKISIILAHLLELDKLLDEQHKNRKSIIKNIKGI